MKIGGEKNRGSTVNQPLRKAARSTDGAEALGCGPEKREEVDLSSGPPETSAYSGPFLAFVNPGLCLDYR